LNSEILLDAATLDAFVNKVVLRFNESIATSGVDAAVSRALHALDVHEYVSSHAPGLYAIIVTGFVGAILNCVAIQTVVLWVVYLKRAAKQTDAVSI
jgi:hypothetical protein